MRAGSALLTLLGTIAALLVFAASPLLSAPAPAYQIIVHPKNPSSSVERKFIANAFLKKVVKWPDGEGIRPVDLGPDSPVRQKFSEEVLSRSVSAIKNYWQQLIFSGTNVPPPELESDDAVLQYVASHRGAIGYVSGSAHLGTVKTLSVQ